MSAFLGPIHVKMYGRILYQDHLAEKLLTLAEEQGWVQGLRKAADLKAPAAAKAPLETLINPSNIHGWLNEAVARSESRFALIVGSILQEDSGRVTAMQNITRQCGREAAMPPGLDAERIFQGIHNLLLDGMPCDFPFDMRETGPEAVVWDVVSCPHGPFWGGDRQDAEAYYLLRDAWVEGALEGTDFVHERQDTHHCLRKES